MCNIATVIALSIMSTVIFTMTGLILLIVAQVKPEKEIHSSFLAIPITEVTKYESWTIGYGSDNQGEYEMKITAPVFYGTSFDSCYLYHNLYTIEANFSFSDGDGNHIEDLYVSSVNTEDSFTDVWGEYLVSCVTNSNDIDYDYYGDKEFYKFCKDSFYPVTFDQNFFFTKLGKIQLGKYSEFTLTVNSSSILPFDYNDVPQLYMLLAKIRNIKLHNIIGVTLGAIGVLIPAILVVFLIVSSV